MALTAAPPRPDSGWLRRTWWVPLALIVASLVVLTAMPVIVSHRVRELRRALTDVSDEGRVVINDLEEGLATELLHVTTGRGPRPAVQRDVTPQLDRDATRLDSLARTLGPDATARAATLHTLILRWQERHTAGVRDDETLREALAAARTFEQYLDALAERQRAEIQHVERLDVISAFALAPLALVAAVLVFWIGGRTLRLADEAEHGRRELMRALESKAALMRGVTHDLKNPLGAAGGYLELLRDGIVGPLTPPQREMASRAQQLLGVAVETVEDLLDLSRADRNELSMSLSEVDLDQLVRSAAEDYRASAGNAGLALTIAASPGPALTRTDPLRVRRILGNLLSNAVKYTPRGGCVSVGVVRDGRCVCIEVADTGPGIPPELRDRIFDEFFRVSGTQAPGAGIGLAVSRRVARLLHGDLIVRENGAGGSVFVLSLPAGDGAAA